MGGCVMRSIKFRAWDKETKEMSYDFLSKNWLKVCVESPYVELMQYTGLTDRNGKEIYEGDILKDDQGTGEVKWMPEHCQFVVRTVEPHLYHSFASDGQLNQSEVIGNIYENHELLEVS